MAEVIERERQGGGAGGGIEGGRDGGREASTNGCKRGESVPRAGADTADSDVDRREKITVAALTAISPLKY